MRARDAFLAILSETSYAYVTDLQFNKLMTVDVAAALAGKCVVDFIETPVEYFLATGVTFPRHNGKIDG